MTRAEIFLPLSPTNYYVLTSLIQEPKHGYAILKAVEDLSDGEIRPGIGNLYVGLRRLLDQGLIERAGQCQQSSGERRKVYRISGLGEMVLSAEQQRLRRMVQAARVLQ